MIPQVQGNSMKLAIFAALGAATMAVVPSTAEAQVQRQLQFHNTCPIPVRYFIAIPRNGAWQTHGWFNAAGGKPLHDLLDRNRNPIFLAEGTRVYYYAETTEEPSVRWYGNTNINMNGASFATKQALLSVRGGKFQFGLNCDKEMNARYAAPPAPPAPTYREPRAGGPPPGGPRPGGPRPGAGLPLGSRVMCNFKRAGTYYPGRISQMRADGWIHIEYDDGDREWTMPGACRRA